MSIDNYCANRAQTLGRVLSWIWDRFHNERDATKLDAACEECLVAASTITMELNLMRECIARETAPWFEVAQ